MREADGQSDSLLRRLFTDPLPILEGVFPLVFFQLPTGWGLHYGRPIVILLVFTFLMTMVYMVPLSVGGAGKGRDCIYRIWPRGRIEDEGNVPQTADDESVERLHPKGLAVLTFAFYFSVLSAFQIGWRKFNVGSWIARLQPREYFLRARGWVRVVSGSQSLVSVYLLAMWALTYFGRPFQ